MILFQLYRYICVNNDTNIYSKIWGASEGQSFFLGGQLPINQSLY